MIWDVLNYIFGAIAIAGSVAVAFWYFGEAKKKIKEL